MLKIKIRAENPEVNYTEDFPPRTCYECENQWVCKHKDNIELFWKTLPVSLNTDMSVVHEWLFSWAIWCRYYGGDEEE